MLDAQDKKRAEQIQARNERIQKIMNSMGDVMKKSDAAERAEATRLLNQQLEKDRQAAKAEKDKEKQKRLANQRVLETLDQ